LAPLEKSVDAAGAGNLPDLGHAAD
jgi:hypothetical protein